MIIGPGSLKRGALLFIGVASIVTCVFATLASEGYYSIGDMIFGVTRQISVGGNGVMIYDNNI